MAAPASMALNAVSISTSLTTLLFAASLGLTPVVSAQTVFDDFNGTSIDPGAWFTYGDDARLTKSGGFVRMQGAGATDTFGAVAIDGVRGSFEIVLDFEGFASHSTQGDPFFSCFVFDAIGDFDSSGHLGIALMATPTGRRFYVEAHTATMDLGQASIATTASAGKLRLKRDSGFVAAAFQEKGQTAWTTLRTWPDFLRTDTVRFGFESLPGSVDGVDVAIDRVTLAGTRVAGSKGYGKGCASLRAFATNFPRLGTPKFSILNLSDASFAAAPFALLLGVQALGADLTAAGAPACSLLASPDFVFVGGVLDSDGWGFVSLPVPSSPSLVGGTFFNQLIALTQKNSMGIAWSNGVSCKITN